MAIRLIFSPCKTWSRAGSPLHVVLNSAEVARPIQHPDAFDYILRGRSASLASRTPDTYREMVQSFERALALDPRSVEAQSLLATFLAGRVMDNMTDTAAADMSRAEDLAGRASAASPQSYLARFARAQVLRAQRRFAEAIPEYETVLAFNRNYVFAIYALAQCKLFTGSIDDTIPLVEQAIRLSPRDRTWDIGINKSGWCICCSRARTRRSFGSKKRAAPCRLTQASAPRSLPPTPSPARPNAHPRNSPKPAG